MKTGYCGWCKRHSTFQRKLGFGTLFAVMITGGFWLLTIPFYPVRCTHCGKEWKERGILT